MGSVIPMKGSGRKLALKPLPRAGSSACEIVIFPGVRIERHDLDLSHRVTPSAGRGDFDGIGGSGRPRKTS